MEAEGFRGWGGRGTVGGGGGTTVLVRAGRSDTRNVTREVVVQSNQLANLMLSIQHEGPVHDAGSKGWLTRAVEAIFPF